MSSQSLSPSLLKFISDCVHSIEQLEILLLLHIHPNKEWTVEDISRDLRNNPQSGSDRLEELYRAGLVKKTKSPALRFQYGPVNNDLRDRVDELAREYLVRRLRVVDAIYSRSIGVQQFANAFRVREENKDA